MLQAAAVEIASAVAIAAVDEGVAPPASQNELQERVVASQWPPVTNETIEPGEGQVAAGYL
ncbi:MAG: hypothetical protein QOD13_3336 [Thermoleophilaceae bacterium]|nr:hypothetical protein [Thermoleophilaceae bacterium]